MSLQESYIMLSVQNATSQQEAANRQFFQDNLEQFRSKPDTAAEQTYISYQTNSNCLRIVIEGKQYVIVPTKHEQAIKYTTVSTIITPTVSCSKKDIQTTLIDNVEQFQRETPTKSIINQTNAKSIEIINIIDDEDDNQPDFRCDPPSQPLFERNHQLIDVTEEEQFRYAKSTAKKDSKKPKRNAKSVIATDQLVTIVSQDDNVHHETSLSTTQAPIKDPVKIKGQQRVQSSQSDPVDFSFQQKDQNEVGSFKNVQPALRELPKSTNTGTLTPRRNRSAFQSIQNNKDRSHTPKRNKIKVSNHQMARSKTRSRTPERFPSTNPVNQRQGQLEEDISSSDESKIQFRYREDYRGQIVTNILGKGEQFDRQILLECLEKGVSTALRPYRLKQEFLLLRNKIVWIYALQCQNDDIKDYIRESTSKNLPIIQHINELYELYKQLRNDELN